MGRVTEVEIAGPGQERAAHRSNRGLSVSVRSRVLAGAGAVLMCVVVVVGYQLAYANAIFPGVRVGEVNLGGMSRDRALATLRPLYAQRSSQQLLLRGPDAQWQVRASDVGAVYDASSAVDAAFAVGRTGNWGERLTAEIGALARGYAIGSPGIGTDQPKLQAYVAQLAQQIDRPVKDADLVIGSDLSVKVSPAVVGRKLDVAATAGLIEKAATAGTGTVDLPVTQTQPKRTEQDFQAARDQVAKMLSGPLDLEFGGRRWTITPKEIAPLISVGSHGGSGVATVTLNDAALKSLVDRIGGEIDQPPIDARLNWNGGKIKVLTPGQDGRTLDRAKTASLIAEALKGDQRTVSLPVAVAKAIGDSIDPSTLGIKERIQYGQTHIAGVPEKVHNIKLAASRLNGIVLRPGEVFSFNNELGPTTLKAGFQIGFGITVNDGDMETVPSVGGGICQVATTLLHAVFWAGYQIDERYPHLYWIPTYGQPPTGLTGLDATVDAPNLDFKFENNTGNYMLIQTKTDNNTLEFDLYGTKPAWKVDVQGPIITNVVKPDTKTVIQKEPTWDVGRQLWVEAAGNGMDVDIIRRVIQGDNVRTLDLKSKYEPSQNVLMVGSKKPTSDATAPAATATPGTH